MARRKDAKKDELADALSQLAGGEFAPDDTHHGADGEEKPESGADLVDLSEAPAQGPTPPPPPPPQTAAPERARAASSSPHRPPAPAGSRRPVTPVRPAAPPSAQAKPPAAAAQPPPAPARRQRPAAPSAANGDAGQFAVIDDAGENGAPAGDDDAVIVPAPSIDMLAHTPSPARHGHRSAILRSLQFRRTLIPILLTNGGALPALGGLWFITSEDSPFRAAGTWLPTTLIAVGLVLLGLGILNVLHVRHELQADRPADG